MRKSIQEPFLAIDKKLLKLKSLNPIDKQILSDILSFSPQLYFKSDSTLEYDFGVCNSTIQRSIKKIKKLPFVRSKNAFEQNAAGKKKLKRFLSIDRNKMAAYVEAELKVLDKTVKYIPDESETGAEDEIPPRIQPLSELSIQKYSDILSNSIYTKEKAFSILDKFLEKISTVVEDNEHASEKINNTLKEAVWQSVLLNNESKVHLCEWIRIYQQEELPKLYKLLNPKI